METQEMINGLVARSKAAQKVVENYTQEQVDAIARMFAKVVYDNAEELGKFDLYVPQRRPTQDDRQDHRSHAGYGRGYVDACVRRLFFLPVPTHLEPSIDGDRIKYSPTSANVREKP